MPNQALSNVMLPSDILNTIQQSSLTYPPPPPATVTVIVAPPASPHPSDFRCFFPHVPQTTNTAEHLPCFLFNAEHSWPEAVAHRDMYVDNPLCEERDREVQWNNGFNQPRDMGYTGVVDVEYAWQNGILETVEGSDADVECSNVCATSHNNVCDDGGFGSDFDTCAAGTDCFDCRLRFAEVFLLSRRGMPNRARGWRANTRLPDGRLSYHALPPSDDCLHPVTGVAQPQFVNNGVCQDGGRKHGKAAATSYDDTPPVGHNYAKCAYNSDSTDWASHVARCLSSMHATTRVWGTQMTGLPGQGDVVRP